MDDTGLFEDVFCIPHKGKCIIYLPLRGILLLGNAKFVNLLCRARLGDKGALKRLNIDQKFINEFFASKRQLDYLRRPRPLTSFQPTSVSLFLTNDCTLRCRYCYAEGGSNTLLMPWHVASGVLDNVLGHVLATRSPEMTVHFHGGGDVSAAWPLLVRTREYLSKLTAPHHIKVRTSVGLNGILNREQRDWIVRNIDSATVSIDGPAHIHNLQRPLANGGPSLSFVTDTLEAFDASSYSYGIRCTVTDISVTHLEEIVSYFCDRFGTKRIKVEPMYPRGRAASSQLLKPPSAMAFIRQFRRAHKVALDAGRELVYSGARLNVLSNVFCQAAGESCAITPSGQITSCYEVLNSKDPLSKMFFYGYFDLNSGRLVVDEERRRYLFNLSVLDKRYCANCFCKWHCAGDCPVKVLHARSTGSHSMTDRCYINRELTKDQLIERLNGDKMERSQGGAER